MISRLDPMPLVLLKLNDHYEPLLRSRPVRLMRWRSAQMRGWVQRRP
jgi:hypothetical protein